MFFTSYLTSDFVQPFVQDTHIKFVILNSPQRPDIRQNLDKDLFIFLQLQLFYV